MLRKLILALSAAFIACAPAHAQTGSAKTPAVLNTETDTLWPDNSINGITPFNARQTLLDIIASYSAYVPIIVVTTPVTLTTLQSAINTACSAGNAIVQIPTGSWTIDTTSAAITISSCPSIIIQGSGGITSGGPNGTLLNNSAAANDLFTVTTNGSVVFQDFAINASVTKNAGTALIHLNNATTGLSQQIIQRMSMNGGCNSIQVDNSFQFIIEDNLLTSFTCEGIIVTQPTIADQGNNIIARNKIWDVAGTAGADSCILWHRGSGVRIEANRCLGAFNYGLHIQFDGTFGDDGALIAIGNTFEVQKLSGIYVERTAGALAAGKKIGQLILSTNFIQSIVSGGTGSINIADSGSGPWVQGCTITSISMQINVTQANNAGIEIDGADQCNIADNMMYVTGGAAAGIRVAGHSTNTKVINNSNDGTTAATKYSLNSTTTLIDMAGMAVANLPATVGNGSMVYATDGSPTNPITGNGSGAVAMRVNGAWVAAGVVKPMTQQRLTTGTNATYTAPTAPAPSFIKTTCWGAGGGGGGGAGTSTGGGTGGTGGATCFGTNATACTTPTVSAPGGIGGIGGGNGGSLANAAAGGAGGAAGSAIGDGAFSGFPGTGSPPAPSNVAGSAGTGGGQGAGKGGAISTVGGTGLAPGGGGGGGGGASTVAIAAGAGGGSGGQAWAIIAAPAATYNYTVGAAGSAGTAGTGGATPAAGGAGGPGYCTVDEGYQ